VSAGAAAFREMCAGYHGARDMNPPPPDLTQIVAERTPAELFWVIKHGIHMSRMPAWGPTHSETDLWGLVAFLQRLPGRSADTYEQLAGSGNPPIPIIMRETMPSRPVHRSTNMRAATLMIEPDAGPSYLPTDARRYSYLEALP
jgi:hypothetical protein